MGLLYKWHKLVTCFKNHRLVVVLKWECRPVGWGGSGGSDEPPHLGKRSALPVCNRAMHAHTYTTYAIGCDSVASEYVVVQKTKDSESKGT